MASQMQFNTLTPSGSDQHYVVPAASVATQIMSASPEQRGWASIFNDSPQSLYIKFGNNQAVGISGSQQIFDVKIASSSYYEMPFPQWQGEVWGVWDGGASPSGFARVLWLGVPGLGPY